MAVEKTLVILKPDAVKRRLVGEIISAIENKDLSITYMEIKDLSDEDLNYHYHEHIDKPYFPSLMEYMQSGSVVILVVEGENAIKVTRKLSGSTDPLDAESGSIRGKYAISKTKNIIHASDSEKSAVRETSFFVEGKKE
ncbi:nucleoside-diphosphate kinase [Alkalibacter saccharofermentans]|uniref:Nucleoside diphosphate kinase n=1 Tax=Alkalibacter saccharofermentans DSM 14828 TaxID=1120975 RepID=A0A1M4XL18_9FIRM|nr:nucleoside-diphosphate kinase [Alkalibacter saccharofermentans]SHE94078.1 nucleoside diphosphate kinase [Alkalibacter saccharofermentans DSM 14828]